MGACPRNSCKTDIIAPKRVEPTAVQLFPPTGSHIPSPQKKIKPRLDYLKHIGFPTFILDPNDLIEDKHSYNGGEIILPYYIEAAIMLNIAATIWNRMLLHKDLFGGLVRI
ncbi:hypothetical protein CIHG_01310 [Coccidioides immitis H538.4]|uniref:Uncharacterized protein n=2 Tax=Coccidioides immitis TaxID=5501 RepID=A0A0J8U8X0_COCIT|nr:hypothetical protein CIRG_01155 [Coccidioides immitis RMSCC 2394]KMU83528.1 hypothetical protein CIHG_01310 [Coccidioides immitis H538.4]